MGRLFATLRYDVCCVVHWFLLESCVSCPSRRWPRPWNRTPPWRSWFWSITTSALKGPRRGVWWRWDHEGKGVKKLQKTLLFESDIRERRKNSTLTNDKPVFYMITTSVQKGQRFSVWSVWRGWCHEGSRHSRLKVTSGKYWKAMQWSVDSQTCDICDPMKLESRKAPFNDWSLVINRKLWNINNRLAVPFLIDEPWDWLLILLFLPKHLWYDVCCVLHRVSQVMCLLPGSGRGRPTELHPDEPEFGE